MYYVMHHVHWMYSELEKSLGTTFFVKGHSMSKSAVYIPHTEIRPAPENWVLAALFPPANPRLSDSMYTECSKWSVCGDNWSSGVGK